MAGKAVTLSDVAAVAGVSISTASKALSGNGRISAETRARIADAVERLDYRPNALAQSFAKGRSQTIGVLAYNAPGAFSMPVLTGANIALGRHEMASLNYDARRDERLLQDHVRRLQARQVDGVLVIGDGFQRPVRSVTHGFSGPVVYAYGMPDNTSDIVFRPDSYMAGRLAAEHILGLGRTRIAHITARDDSAAIDRARGFTDTLDAAGVALVTGEPIRGDWTREWGMVASRQLIQEHPRVDAIFCGNDPLAFGTISSLRAAGARVPDDVAVVGVDNIGGATGQSYGVLTTVDPLLQSVGAAAAEYLLTLIAGEDAAKSPRIHDLPCTLVLGESTTGTPASEVDIREAIEP